MHFFVFSPLCQARKHHQPNKAMAPLKPEFANVFTKPMGLHPPCSIEHHIDLIRGASLSNAPSFCLAGKSSIGPNSSKKHVVSKGRTSDKNLRVVKGYATSNGGNNGVQRKPSMVTMAESSSSNSSSNSATQVGEKSMSAAFGQSVDTLFNNKQPAVEWQSMKGPVVKDLKGPVVEDFVLFSNSCYFICMNNFNRSLLLMGKPANRSAVSQGQISRS